MLVESKFENQKSKIALIQLGAVREINEQLERISLHLELAHHQNVQLVILPEECLTLHLDKIDKQKLQETYKTGILQNKIAQLAKRYNLWILAGTLPIRSDYSDKFYSSSILFSPLGEIKTRYDKIHLFDVDIELGQERYRESEYVVPGNKIVTYKLPFAHIGIAICYDLRFPELFRAMVQQGVDLFILPSAFTIRTGKEHWETLVKARAIENLSFFAACNHAGIRKNGEGTYGHSMIVNPWGKILTMAGENEEMIIQTLDFSELRKIRSSFPVLQHYQPFIKNYLF